MENHVLYNYSYFKSCFFPFFYDNDFKKFNFKINNLNAVDFKWWM